MCSGSSVASKLYPPAQWSVTAEELLRILAEAPRAPDGASVVDRPVALTEKVVPPIVANRVVFRGPVDFHRSRFDRMRFDDCRFEDNAWFDHATFTGVAVFRGTVFLALASFVDATFADAADFSVADFAGAQFDGAHFGMDADFVGARFVGPVLFRDTAFDKDARFTGATFEAAAVFRGAQIRFADFGGCSFEGKVDLGATFQTPGRFDGVKFAGDPAGAENLRDLIPVEGELPPEVAKSVEMAQLRRTVRHQPEGGGGGQASPTIPPDGGGGGQASPTIPPDGGGGGQAGATTPPEGGGAGQASTAWDTISSLLQIVGAGAAFVAWVVVVGGAIVWARLQAAELPRPTRTVTLLPREALLAEGIRALTTVVLVGTAVALVVLLLGLNERGRRAAVSKLRGSGSSVSLQLQRHHRFWAYGLVLTAVLIGAMVLLAALEAPFGVPWWVVFGIAGVVGVLVAAVATGIIAVSPRDSGSRLRSAPAWRQLAHALLMVVLVAAPVVAMALIANLAWQEPTDRNPERPSLWTEWWVLLWVLTVLAVLHLVVAVIRATELPRRWHVWVVRGLAAVMVVSAALILIEASSVEPGWWIVLILVATVVLVLGALASSAIVGSPNRSNAIGLAAVVFAAFLVIGGAWRFLRELGDESPEFERARVTLSDGTSLRGLLLGQTGDDLALICGRREKGRHVLVVSIKDAKERVFRTERGFEEARVGALACRKGKPPRGAGGAGDSESQGSSGASRNGGGNGGGGAGGGGSGDGGDSDDGGDGGDGGGYGGGSAEGSGAGM
jgi:uncharacterized protein YjbI with pentapeptide repeats